MYIHTYIHACIHMYICSYVCIKHMRVYVHIRVYVCVHMTVSLCSCLACTHTPYSMELADANKRMDLALVSVLLPVCASLSLSVPLSLSCKCASPCVCLSLFQAVFLTFFPPLSLILSLPPPLSLSLPLPLFSFSISPFLLPSLPPSLSRYPSASRAHSRILPYADAFFCFI